jgi:hypothetical protein
MVREVFKECPERLANMVSLARTDKLVYQDSLEWWEIRCPCYETSSSPMLLWDISIWRAPLELLKIYHLEEEPL